MSQGEVRFDGRVILITGAGRGLGRSNALLLAARGAKVVVADNGAAMDGAAPSTAPAASVVGEILAAGGEAVACTADIGSEAGSTEAVAASLAAFGRIDGILHNASTAPNIATADALSSRDLDGVMRINPLAGLWLTRAAWPHLTRQNYGRIAYMTSAAIYGAEGSAPYAAAKAAYIGLMRSLAPEGARHGVYVNVVAPAAYTRMTERMPASPYSDWFAATMAPEKTSAGVAFMLSEDCRVYGEILSIGGGRIARITVAESEGYVGRGDSIEEVRELMPKVMADTRFFYPRNLEERSLEVARLLGFEGALGENAYAVKPIGKD